MSVEGARRLVLSTFVRAGLSGCASAVLAGLILIGANDSLQTASAEGDTRTLSFLHLHTKETITVTFKRDGSYDQAALKKLNWFMRDWRTDQSVPMDPHLFDLMWETYREVGGQKPIEVIGGYRAPGTNAMLRARSSGVARNSQHVNGHAIDFEIPGVPLAKIREVGLRLQRGGVGFYPTSGSPFVHLDTGSVRHWPRMTRDQLVKVFPDGRTVHVPSDGVPLSGYALALADVEARGKQPNGVSLAAARDAGIITASIEASAKSSSTGNSTGKPKRSLLARIFGSDQPEEDDAEQAAPQRSAGPLVLASLSTAAKPKPIKTAKIIPLPAARPKTVSQPVAVASVAPANMFDNRGIWIGAVESGELPPPVNQSPFALASLDTATTGSTGRSTASAALGYAAAAPDTPDAPLPRPARARPMGAQMPQLAATASIMPRSTATAVTFTQRFTPALTGGGQRSGSPWLRAAMLTPSVSSFMSATPLTPPHMRPLVNLIYKPEQSLVMMFSAEPHLGLITERFSGHAVEFLATATFIHQTTASLR